MPRINRVRIVNFSYNNDSRRIVDETFNFHGGENALLNLANGGGKSVLVQLFLQPVVPGVRIQGRNIADFFRKKKLPAYVMLEWKLDGAGGYLVTGIGLVSAEAAGAEEEKGRIRHFTFTSKYTGSNPFDIAHMDLGQRHGGILEVMPFREARDLLSEKARKDSFSFGYFSGEDGDRYARHLAEFGIAQDEWRNVLARINDSEGGLEEIFQKYKNSSQLLNDWIIKTVEKAMFKNRSEARRLEEMLEGLVQEVVENERFILEKQLLDSFLGAFQEQVQDLAGLLKGLDLQKGLEGKLAALHTHLTSQAGWLQERQEENEQEMEACKAQEQRIRLEERSNEYFSRQREYQEALKRLKAAEFATGETEGYLDKARLRDKIMQGSRLAGEIHRAVSELAGIEQSLWAAKEHYDADGMISRLEYSLKLLLEESLELIARELTDLQGAKAQKEDLKMQAREELQAIEGEKSSLYAEKGRLEERKRNLEKHQRDVQSKLSISLSRNLLGETDALEIKRAGAALEKARDGLNRQAQVLEEEKAAGALRRQNIDGEVKELQKAFTQEKMDLGGIDRDILDYEQREQQINSILYKYGFDFADRFDRERLAADFTKQVKSLEARLEEAARDRDEATESLQALKSGRLHTPPELATLLNGLDIQYDTGEAYLRSLSPEIRQQMLGGNPVLPYAFIMSRVDLDQVAGAVQGLTLRRAIPLIAYEDLATTVQNDGRVARTRDGMAFACLYEGRMFESESLAGLVAGLEQKKDAALEQHSHISVTHREAVSDQEVYAGFNYAAEHRYKLGIKKSEAEKRLVDIDENITSLEEEKKRLKKREAKLEPKLKECLGALLIAGEAVVLFAKFIEKEKDYQECRGKLADVLRGIAGLEARKVQLTGSQEILQKDIDSLTEQVWVREKGQREARERYSLYKDAPAAVTLEGSIQELEERLRALKNEYSWEIGELEKRKKYLSEGCGRKQKELGKLGLEEEQYAGVAYDETAAESISEEISRLDGLLKKRLQEEKAAIKVEGAAGNALENALDEVKRLGAEAPLSPEEIRGDFVERRRRAVGRAGELRAKNKEIAEQAQEYRRIREKIERLVDLAVSEPEKGFMPDQDIAAQATGLEQSFSKTQSENLGAAGRLRNKYAGLKGDYRDKNSNIDNIFKGLDFLWDKANMGFDEYFYLFERMGLHGDKLTELIRLHEVQLANLELSKNDMVQQSFQHGLRFYEEIQWISDNSRVPLQGRKRPVQMLKIELQLDSKDAARQRIKEYIEGCIVKVREEARQEKKGDEVRRTVARLMSSRELLNMFLGSPYIPVSVFKIDLNMQNSRLKLWEDALRENSGGEKFVVYFSVLSALMTYTRARAMEAAGADANTDTRVLIMDNPFGPISSEHLLSPLFEIAKKHRTQLICLSDLKQNSIMNCFNLIYMLKVRNSAIGSNEYLKFEEIIRDEGAVQNDERLEKAVFRASEVRQVSLFEEM